MKHLLVILALFISLAAFAQGSKPSTAQMKLDLVGQSFVDPDPQSYFGPESKCVVGRGEIRGISVVKETVSDDKYVAQVIVHLGKKGMLVDVLALVQYRRQAEGWRFGRARARSITFPLQHDYSHMISLSKDMDFIPMMMARSSARDTLMVGFEIVQNSETTRFVMILAPRESKPATMMIPDDIKVEFAYVYDADYDLLNSLYSERETDFQPVFVDFEGIFDPETYYRSGGFQLRLYSDSAILFLRGYEYYMKRSVKDGVMRLEEEDGPVSFAIPLPAGVDATKAPVLTGFLDFGCEIPGAILYRPDMIK